MKKRSRVVIVLIVLVVLVAAGLRLARKPVGDWLFTRAVEKNVGIDPSVKLADGLHAYLCGSGSPLPDTQRAGPCVAVLAGQDAFVFDAGSGSVRKLLRMGFPIGKLKGVFLTHLHSDHIDGLGELLLQSWIGGSRAAPTPVYGPAGTDRVVNGLREAYAIDEGFRIAHHGAKVANPAGYGGEAHILSLPDGLPGMAPAWRGDGVTITVVRVHHDPVKPAFGYRIDYKGRSLTLSGDTTYSQTLAEAARGSDVLFHEAMNMGMVREMGAVLARRGQANTARIMHDIQGYHSSPEDAARVAREAGAKLLVLYHLVPPLPSRFMDAAFLGDAPDDFGGKIIVGRDGLRIDLPAGSKAIETHETL
ncbi:MAG: MBL fold metallo-hydrolase [Sphingomonadales bacterium]|nr:MBL fold metallo-hydrolase [Sphingomonadales bacterium]MDE2568053.1 MBL fold metallo-hydrolase [Sphingomonadales bacterium]